MSPDRRLETLLRRLQNARREAAALPSGPRYAVLCLLAVAEGAAGELREQRRRLRMDQRALEQRRRQVEEQLRRLQAELIQMPRLSLLGEIVSELAHQLNQPLAASVSYAQAGLQQLRNGQARPEGLTEILEQVAAQGKRAGQILQRLRCFTRARRLQRQASDLAALCREVVTFTNWEAQCRGVRIDLEIERNLPPVPVDELQIKQVLLNLLCNAIHVMADHGADRRIVLRLSRSGPDSIQIAVADNGPGINDAVMNRMFEPFFTTRPDALGMGLCLSRTIVEDHGGRLWGEPNPDRGATFYLSLPMAPPPE